MEKVQPIQRSPELTPLSRDHHTGLLTGWKIRAGIRNNVELRRIVEFVSACWSQELQQHFNQEEQFVFPLIPENDAIRKALTHHKEIKDLIMTVQINPDREVLEKIADLLTEHIRFEERELFPFIEKNADSDMFHEAGKIIAQLHEHQSCMVWKDEFWRSDAKTL